MIGIEPQRAREVFHIPEDTEAITALAIGYPNSNAEHLPEQIRSRDLAPRQRKPLSAFVFEGAWDTPSSLIKDA